MKIATVVISKMFEEYVGNKLQERTAIRLEDLEVESLISEAEFIPLSNDFPSYSPSDAVTLHETEPTLDFVKDAKPDTLKNTQNFKFVRTRFSKVALVGLPDGKIQTEDPYGQAERYNAQLALIPIPGGTLTLPVKANYIATLRLSGYFLAAQCSETGQTFRLGYHVDGSPDPNWVEQALLRRKHYQRGHKNSDEDVQPTRNLYPSFWSIVDADAAKQINFADRRDEMPNGDVRMGFFDQDDYERAEQIQKDIVADRYDAVRAR